MVGWKLKLWRSAGSAALVAVAACGETTTSAVRLEPPAPAAPSGEAGAGEQGEAGGAEAYAGLTGEPRTALHLQQLKGFLLVADRVAAAGQTEDASMLVHQGLIEAYLPVSAEFGNFDAASVRAAGEAQGAADLTQKLRASEAAIDAARDALSVNHADLAARMVDISSALYRNVIQDAFVDPIEYRHSFGAALASRDALLVGRAAIRASKPAAYDDAMREIERYIALFAVTPPADATPYRLVLAQSSRVRLALSALL